MLTVFVTTNTFSENDRQYYNSKTICIPVATNSDLELIHYANLALKAIYREGYFYKKSGVIVGEIIPENQVQLGLLDTIDREKHRNLMTVLDGLTDKFGRSKVKVATQGLDGSWQLKSEYKSPCYTTRISELQTVKVG
jgi:DNA polymerase V